MNIPNLLSLYLWFNVAAVFCCAVRAGHALVIRHDSNDGFSPLNTLGLVLGSVLYLGVTGFLILALF